MSRTRCRRSRVALAIAVVLGLLIGFALGLHRLSAEAMEPMLVALYSIPKITLYPIILLVFGLGMSAKIAFGAIHGIIPVALFTLNAVRSTKPILVKTGRVLKLSPPTMVRSILFPAAVPEIFTGLRVGFSLTLIGTVLGEMFASQHGLGLSADERDRPLQRRRDHVGDVPAGRLRGGRERDPARDRSPPAFSRLADDRRGRRSVTRRSCRRHRRAFDPMPRERPATKPDAFISSTKSRRYFAPASRPRGVPIA